jgi:biopolymer transport protein ExbD
MAMGPSGSGEEAVPYINVTPLIDVLLVLLIIFMVITPLKPSRFEAKIPTEPDPTQQNFKPNPLTLVVSIGSDRTLKLNTEELGTLEDTSKLGKRLSEVFAERKDKHVYRANTNEIETTVFLKAPKNTAYGEVVRVIDTVKGAGGSPIGLQIDDLQ